ncbi:zinc finger protein, putative [Hepatocystis sp. ex Piliocolobus tephrosceles]|nr:zinc finger protein, putative [Hepatocystis sp. ex Piliocolobus tephrosceles]
MECAAYNNKNSNVAVCNNEMVNGIAGWYNSYETSPNNNNKKNINSNINKQIESNTYKKKISKVDNCERNGKEELQTNNKKYEGKKLNGMNNYVDNKVVDSFKKSQDYSIYNQKKSKNMRSRKFSKSDKGMYNTMYYEENEVNNNYVGKGKNFETQDTFNDDMSDQDFTDFHLKRQNLSGNTNNTKGCHMNESFNKNNSNVNINISDNIELNNTKGVCNNNVNMYSANVDKAAFNTFENNNKKKNFHQEKNSYTFVGKQRDGNNYSDKNIKPYSLKSDDMNTVEYLNNNNDTNSTIKNNNKKDKINTNCNNHNNSNNNSIDYKRNRFMGKNKSLNRNNAYEKKEIVKTFTSSTIVEDSIEGGNDYIHLPTSTIHSGFSKPSDKKADTNEYTSNREVNYDFKSALNFQFCKTKMCPYMNTKEKCKRFSNNMCPYAHDKSELKPIPNLYKTAMCRNFMKNMCFKSKKECNFAHNVEELRSTDEFYKTTLCKFYLNGYCKADKNCRHAHGQKELKCRPTNYTLLENGKECLKNMNTINIDDSTEYSGNKDTNNEKENSKVHMNNDMINNLKNSDENCYVNDSKENTLTKDEAGDSVLNMYDTKIDNNKMKKKNSYNDSNQLTSSRSKSIYPYVSGEVYKNVTMCENDDNESAKTIEDCNFMENNRRRSKVKNFESSKSYGRYDENNTELTSQNKENDICDDIKNNKMNDSKKVSARKNIISGKFNSLENQYEKEKECERDVEDNGMGIRKVNILGRKDDEMEKLENNLDQKYEQDNEILKNTESCKNNNMISSDNISLQKGENVMSSSNNNGTIYKEKDKKNYGNGGNCNEESFQNKIERNKNSKSSTSLNSFKRSHNDKLMNEPTKIDNRKINRNVDHMDSKNLNSEIEYGKSSSMIKSNENSRYMYNGSSEYDNGINNYEYDNSYNSKDGNTNNFQVTKNGTREYNKGGYKNKRNFNSNNNYKNFNYNDNNYNGVIGNNFNDNYKNVNRNNGNVRNTNNNYMLGGNATNSNNKNRNSNSVNNSHNNSTNNSANNSTNNSSNGNYRNSNHMNDNYLNNNNMNGKYRNSSIRSNNYNNKNLRSNNNMNNCLSNCNVGDNNKNSNNNIGNSTIENMNSYGSYNNSIGNTNRSMNNNYSRFKNVKSNNSYDMVNTMGDGGGNNYNSTYNNYNSNINYYPYDHHSLSSSNNRTETSKNYKSKKEIVQKNSTLENTCNDNNLNSDNDDYQNNKNKTRYYGTNMKLGDNESNNNYDVGNNTTTHTDINEFKNSKGNIGNDTYNGKTTNNYNSSMYNKDNRNDYEKGHFVRDYNDDVHVDHNNKSSNDHDKDDMNIDRTYMKNGKDNYNHKMDSNLPTMIYNNIPNNICNNTYNTYKNVDKNLLHNNSTTVNKYEIRNRKCIVNTSNFYKSGFYNNDEENYNNNKNRGGNIEMCNTNMHNDKKLSNDNLLYKKSKHYGSNVFKNTKGDNRKGVNEMEIYKKIKNDELHYYSKKIDHSYNDESKYKHENNKFEKKTMEGHETSTLFNQHLNKSNNTNMLKEDIYAYGSSGDGDIINNSTIKTLKSLINSPNELDDVEKHKSKRNTKMNLFSDKEKKRNLSMDKNKIEKRFLQNGSIKDNVEQNDEYKSNSTIEKYINGDKLKTCISCYQYIREEDVSHSSDTVMESSCLKCGQLIKKSICQMIIELIKPQVQYIFSDVNFYVQYYQD